MPGSVAGVVSVVVDVVVLVVMVDEASVVLGSFSTSRSVIQEKCQKILIIIVSYKSENFSLK